MRVLMWFCIGFGMTINLLWLFGLMSSDAIMEIDMCIIAVLSLCVVSVPHD